MPTVFSQQQKKKITTVFLTEPNFHIPGSYKNTRTLKGRIPFHQSMKAGRFTCKIFDVLLTKEESQDESLIKIISYFCFWLNNLLRMMGFL